MYTHPGEELKNILKTHHLKKGVVSKKLGIHQANLSEVFKGKRGITIKLAVKLENAYPNLFRAEVWAWKQLLFELQTTRKSIKSCS